MNLNKTKESEEKYHEEQHIQLERKQSIEHIATLLSQSNDLLEQMYSIYSNYLVVLLKEFVDLFQQNGYIKKQSPDDCTMCCGNKEISFKINSKNDFEIRDCTGDYPHSYLFTVEVENLELLAKHSAFINTATNRVDFWPNNNTNYKEEIELLNEYIMQQKVELTRNDKWKYHLVPLQESAIQLKTNSFKCIAEIIDAIKVHP
jgi:hypothetical protein